eukprot:CAMPEP_0171328688 /NCGR_PEP_ID=MMETSP0878-20121228/796_1 /TAXON_ID=67004 /ORGANISM="Thalassiosira weissflogii, Strain CCMP1336" /LENGTH=374 /DNA_ID=CAMNT_0011828553 /DNA_START=52 /DNA_END=1176 /DNA_ORIENTATION=+
MSFFGLGSGGLQIKIQLTNTPETHPNEIVYLRHRPSWKVRKNVFATALKKHPPVGGGEPGMGDRGAGPSRIVAYSSEQDVEGQVTLAMPPGKKMDHLGIRVKFFGRIDMEGGAHETTRPSHYDFISLSKELLPPGSLYDTRHIPFIFRNIEKNHESYHGRNVSVKYFVRVEVQRQWLPDITQEHEVLIRIRGHEPSVNEPIKMEVGIEDCLHIEFEYERRCFHLGDVICGKIHFLLVRIKIKHMELAVIRRETSGEGVAMSANAIGTGAGGSNDHNNIAGTTTTGSHANTEIQNIVTETQTLLKYEIMDGAPVKGEVIPVRLFLEGIPADVTPTYHAENHGFSVRYFLNLVLVDEEDRRYFKQQEIILWRKDLG